MVRVPTALSPAVTLNLASCPLEAEISPKSPKAPINARIPV